MAAVMTTPRTYARPPRGRPCDGRRVVPPARPALALVPAPVVHPRRRVHSRAIYWRRRVVMAALALGTVALAGRAGVALGGSPLTTSGPRPHLVTHVVAPGDTLWKIAGELDPKADPREIVDLLVEARHTTALTPGETIIWSGR